MLTQMDLVIGDRSEHFGNMDIAAESLLSLDGLRMHNTMNGESSSAVVSEVESTNFIAGRDRELLLQIFPKEVWEKILEGIKDHVTLVNLNNSSPFLRSILLPRGVEFLFPSFWKIFGRKYHDAPRKDIIGGGDGPYEEPEPPEDNWKLVHWFSGIIKLRLVCRTWCQVVDDWYQNQELHFRMREDYGNYYDRHVGVLVNERFISTKSHIMYRFYEKFVSAHYNAREGVATRNPFFGRAVNIDVHHAEWPESEIFLNHLRTILSKYGHYIWYCRLSLDHTFSSWVEWYSSVKSILDLVPNLRKFDLECSLPLMPPNQLEPTTSPEELSEFQEFINLNPLPTYQDVEYLNMITTYMAPPIFHELLRSCGNASMLQICSSNTSVSNYDFGPENFPNLCKLSVTFHSELDLETFCASDGNWSLTKLDIEIDRRVPIEWSRVIAVIQDKWGETLRTLRLNLSNVLGTDHDRNSALLEEHGNLRLNLPHVSSLKLIMHCASSLDFLLPMQNSLEILEIRMYVTIGRESELDLVESMENGKVIKLFSVADRPMESNIWTLFQRLKYISVQYSIEATTSRRKKFNARYHRWDHSREKWHRFRNTSGSHYISNNVVRTWMHYIVVQLHNAILFTV